MMATLTDARDAALAPGGGGWVRRESWPHDRIRVETGVWHYNTPADMGWEDAIAEDWLACDVDGEPTQAQAQGCLFTGPPLNITDGEDPAEYIARMRGRGGEEPDAELRERIAAWFHDHQWSGWMRYMFSKC